jgi:hypothetical protein
MGAFTTFLKLTSLNFTSCQWLKVQRHGRASFRPDLLTHPPTHSPTHPPTHTPLRLGPLPASSWPPPRQTYTSATHPPTGTHPTHPPTHHCGTPARAHLAWHIPD